MKHIMGKSGKMGKMGKMGKTRVFKKQVWNRTLTLHKRRKTFFTMNTFVNTLFISKKIGNVIMPYNTTTELNRSEAYQLYLFLKRFYNRKK